jgi:long-chain acyl-CoA synthetase
MSDVYGLVIQFHLLSSLQGQTLNTPPHPPRPSFLYSIMFTSGDPKGVMLTQSNILTALAGLRTIGILPSDVHLSYLPLAHVFEHLVVLNALLCGAAVGFWRGVC